MERSAVRLSLLKGEQKVVHGGGQIRHRARRPPDGLLEQTHLGQRVQVVLGKRDARTHVEQIAHRRTGVPRVGQGRNVVRQLCIDVQRAIADERPGDDGDQRLAHRHQQMRAVGGHAAVVLLGQHPAAMGDDPAVGRGGRHHVPDGGAPAVRLVVHAGCPTARSDRWAARRRARCRARSPPSAGSRPRAGTSNAVARPTASCPASRPTARVRCRRLEPWRRL